MDGLISIIVLLYDGTDKMLVIVCFRRLLRHQQLAMYYNNNWVDGFFDLLELALADEDEEAFFDDMYEYAVHAGKHLSRAPYRQPQMTGLEWVQRNLGDRKSCYSMFRMSPDMFHSLHSLLVQSYGLKSSTKSTLIEALGMFLWMLGAPQSCRQAED